MRGNSHVADRAALKLLLMLCAHRKGKVHFSVAIQIFFYFLFFDKIHLFYSHHQIDTSLIYILFICIVFFCQCALIFSYRHRGVCVCVESARRDSGGGDRVLVLLLCIQSFSCILTVYSNGLLLNRCIRRGVAFYLVLCDFLELYVFSFSTLYSREKHLLQLRVAAAQGCVNHDSCAHSQISRSS